ncbi:MAG TPA: MBL fold metallo-hydrolase, partial [Gemmatimonadales bacterium]|nr:MBL fold metallo-hydrolase [Gemmatimonadales bacterium]
PAYTLRKTTSPALAPEDLPPLTAVLLSHDHHFDNLDHRGRAMLPLAPAVYTTRAGAERLGGNAIGLEPWQTVAYPTSDGEILDLTATPGRHGPPGGDRGPVLGYVLAPPAGRGPTVYFSGDTVWYEDVAAIGTRFPVQIACLNMGAAMVAVAGPDPLTFTAEGAVALARAWPGVRIVPLHFEGWEHFSEGRAAIEAAFDAAGLTDRLLWCEPGRPRHIQLT